jgi:methyl-accepting chemotaxis protein
MRLATLETRIDEAFDALAQQSAIDSAAPLQALSAQKDSLYQLGRELLDAVDEQDALDPEEQDWYIPLELTQQINMQFVQIYGQTSQWSAQGKSQLDALTQRAAAQSGFTFAVALLAIPAFLGLAFLVALTIFFQINLPLEQLAQAARDLKERKFNPADIAPLAQRRDEIGDMARDFLKMAEAVQSRSAELEREAAEIRAKIK